MKKFYYQVGIDVAKDTLDCSLLREGQLVSYHRIKNTPEGVRAYLKQLQKEAVVLSDTLFCMEHTGIYNMHILQTLVDGNHAVCLEAAMRIKAAIGFTRGKNDKVDSYRIARYAYLHQDQLRLWVPKREVIQQLAHLVALRKRLLKTKVMLQQPLKETKQFLGKETFRTEKAVTDPVVKATERQLKQIEKQSARPGYNS